MRVLVVGGGVIGLATAYRIKRLRGDVDVLVVDMMDGPGMGDTSRSNAAFRAAFTSPLNRFLAKSSIEFYRYVQNVLGFDLGLMNVGYLFLVDEDEVGRFGIAIDEARGQGIGIEEVDLAKLGG